MNLDGSYYDHFKEFFYLTLSTLSAYLYFNSENLNKNNKNVFFFPAYRTFV